MNQELQQASSFKRGIAAAIDLFFSNIIRIIVTTILGNLWLKPKLIIFAQEFKAKFDSEVIGNDPEKMQFLMHHPVFKQALIFFFIVFLSGAIYHILLNCSKWQGTLGKKIMKLKIVKNDYQTITILESTSHYFLSLVPWIFVFYIASYQGIHSTTMYNAIVGNTFNLIFGLITLAWLQIHLITKKKVTTPDLICKIIVVVKNSV